VKGVKAMIISNKQVQQVLESFGKRNSSKDNKQKPHPLPLPNKTSKPVEAARMVIGSAPEVREDRVKELKDSINRNQYDRSGEEIADKMISRSLVDSILGESERPAANTDTNSDAKVEADKN
jgi:negative regulator of flagellin synthesis FlgM